MWLAWHITFPDLLFMFLVVIFCIIYILIVISDSLAFCGGAPLIFTPALVWTAASDFSQHLGQILCYHFICAYLQGSLPQLQIVCGTLDICQRNPGTLATVRHSARGIPGPKSGRHWNCFLRVLLIFLVFTELFISSSDGGEGCSCAMATAEASFPLWIHDLPKIDAKRHGQRPSAHSDLLSWTSTTSSIKKRSIKRAFRRACRDGICWYKGRCFTRSDFPQILHSPAYEPTPPLRPSGHQDLRQYNTKHHSSRRMQFVTWNVGGLSQAKLDEVRHWALSQNLSALALVETRWSWSSEWQDAHWQYIHSGDSTTRGSGILIMVSRKLGTDLRWRECMPGRLVHVQMRLKPRHLDFLACYQYSFQSNTARQTDRQRWWECLEHTLSRLPNRHVLAIAGDFNCSLPMQTAQIGHPGYHWQGRMHQGTQHGDSDIFVHIIRTFDLNVLNSWHPRLGPTFIGQHGHSRIDFCLTRQHLADGFSREVKYLWQAPIKSSMLDHCPLLFQLNKYWIPEPLNRTQTGCTFQQRVQCRTAYLEDTVTWQTFMHQLQHTTSAYVHQSDPHDSEIFPNLHASVLQDVHQFFPPVSHSRPAVWHSTTDIIQCKWHFRNNFLQLASLMHDGLLDLRTFFRFWRNVSRFCALSRRQKWHSRQVRRHRFAEIIAQAQTAADRHNTFQLFQLINRFAPKQSRRRMQLRTMQGQLATEVEEHSILCSFVQEVWSGQPTCQPHPDVIAGTPFSEADVRHALATIPISRAVAPGFAPGAIWRALADHISPWLFSLLQCWWFQENPHIPACWRHGWLCWLPKPGKPPTTPAALRPIALQEPVGKALMGVLCRVG